ncbi:DinB family protein [Halobacillus salinus]|uniref:DinB family protein n=1 Tax=Halobacillus salinus TaxID=192814 RepID=A0A4Z0H3H8_9BACI|nr:DinB family protein [Halobacillus salinus]TGB04953.1 DinB family protein [Halobacillus salinus]
MNFQMNEALEILERTPETLESFLTGLSEGWLHCDEGMGTWSPAQVVDHLIDCEINNWIPRVKKILEADGDKSFPGFDRFAHITNPSYTAIEEKVKQFKQLRHQNCELVRELIREESQVEWKGEHPAFGEVNLRELLSTWVVHDFTHVSQIVRVMAERYREDVGPWSEYLGVLRK